jgi:hypothetical protein
MFHVTTKAQKYIQASRSCSSSHREYKKIGFAIFGFFYDYICILQDTGPRSKELKNLFLRRPVGTFEPSHIYPLISETYPRGKIPHNSALPRRGKLAGGEVGPGEVNKHGG